MLGSMPLGFYPVGIWEQSRGLYSTGLKHVTDSRPCMFVYLGKLPELAGILARSALGEPDPLASTCPSSQRFLSAYNGL